MADTELLPCPFCGGPVELEEPLPSRDPAMGECRWWGVVCRNTINLGGTCAIQQRPSASKEAAIERWNRRAPLASRPAEVDDEGLPALPEATMLGTSRHGSIFRGYTAEQFRQGQRDAVAADRASMPDPEEISDAITEAYNMARVHKDHEAAKHWEELGNSFGRWAAPSHTTNKEK